MNLSYWEYKTLFAHVDYTIVGSGIVGLNTALTLANRFPKAKILILEKGALPQGASTKNAGFACFGSISELLADLTSHTEKEVYELVQMRFDGIRLLRKKLGDSCIDYKQWGGHELFLEREQERFDQCRQNMSSINELLQPIFNADAFQSTPNTFHFRGIKQDYITNTFEAQIDTGKMMATLVKKVQEKGVQILNGITVTDFEDIGTTINIKTAKFEFSSMKLLLATNGFSRELLEEDVQPVRAQVLVTRTIENLHIKGTFHFDEGYYYFRNIDNRILFGGGRNLDFITEATAEFGRTSLVQEELRRLLKEVILPDTPFEIDRNWSGIMGVGGKKRPIIKQLSNNVYCGVRLGGMGIAIGSAVGNELAHLLD